MAGNIQEKRIRYAIARIFGIPGENDGKPMTVAQALEYAGYSPNSSATASEIENSQWFKDWLEDKLYLIRKRYAKELLENFEQLVTNRDILMRYIAEQAAKGKPPGQAIKQHLAIVDSMDKRAGVFIEKLEHTGKDGGPIEVDNREKTTLIRELLSDPVVAERIREHYRQRMGAGVSAD